MNNIQEFYYTINLTAEHHQVAKKFAVQQDTTEKAKQVYLNTLAVFAVEAFLEEISFPTDLEAGDSWNAAVRCFHDVADLLIPELGKIECRPILPGETKVSLPTELEDRIAYVIVQFQEQLNQIQLLGYYPTLDPTSPSQDLEISQLEPIENLIDYLFRLELANNYMVDSNNEVAVKVREVFNNKSIPEIVAQFERIYRTEDELDRRFVLADFLRGLTQNKKDSYQPEIVRGLKKELADDDDLTDLAETILDKLSEIWREDEQNK